MVTRCQAIRPMRDLLERLPRLPVSADNTIDFLAADLGLLDALAEDAETSMRVIYMGIGAIGHLLANSAVMIEDGSISGDSVESLGFLMADLGDHAAACMTLAAACRLQSAARKPKPANRLIDAPKCR